MTSTAVSIGLDDLPGLLSDDVSRRNADLQSLGRAVFDISGNRVLFSRQDPGQDRPFQPAAWLLMYWNGQSCLAGVSAAWANVVTDALVGQSLAQLGEFGLELLGHTRLAPLMPEGLRLRLLSNRRETLPEVPGNLQILGTWVGRHLTTGEPSGHEVQVWGEDDLALDTLVRACARLAVTRMPSPLAGMSIALPLVAARWRVPAHLLADLCVGDVLIVS